MKILSLLLVLISLNSFAASFTKGSGSEFTLSFGEGPKTKLSIYISESSFNKVGVEYYFKTRSIFGKKMWQQYIFKNSGEGPLDVVSGYVFTPELKKAEILTDEFLNVNKGKGVEVNDFLFSKDSEFDKFKVGVEKVEVPAGTVSATHYRKVKNGQTVDFWIADVAKPIGLIKLVSKNPKVKEQNYTIALDKLVKNVKAKIEPSKAVPMSEQGKKLFDLKK